MKSIRHSMYQWTEAAGQGPVSESFDFESYSLFKYGCTHSIDLFAREMAALVLECTHPEQDYLIASSAYRYVPTAAGLLVTKMLQYLPSRFTSLRLYRNRITPCDYSTLMEEDRHLTMDQVDISCEASDLTGKHLLVIDDSIVTGAHEQVISRYFAHQQVDIQFLYILDLSQSKCAQLENELNHLQVSSLSDIGALMKQSGYQLNSRVLKRIFQADREALCNLLISLTPTQHADLLQLALLEGYNRHPAMNENLFIVNNMIPWLSNQKSAAGF